jgi:MFS transporter, ACS family, hexuronate transporter
MSQPPQGKWSGVPNDAGFKIPHLRWYICGLLFLATTINYIDRQVLGILAPDLQHEIGWTELEYGRIVIAFQVSYAFMMLVSGRVLDRIGTRIGFAIAVTWWSLAAMATALARTAAQFGFARFTLGIGEAANFPASIKTVAEWFPKSERALATGIFNGGTNIGAIVAPIMVPLIASRWGWQGAFIGTGALGFFWLILWWVFYRAPDIHPWLSEQEKKFIQADRQPEISARIPLLTLLGYRELWAIAIGKMMTDPVWWFYLFWLPKFLFSEHQIRGLQLIPYLTTVYLISDAGSILGGYLSSALIKRGWTVNRSRKTAMAIFAATVPVVIIASQTRSATLAVILVGIAAAAHQGWSANMFTLASDMFPQRAIGTVIGFAGFAGGVGGILVAEFAGRVLQADPRFYLPMFILAGVVYAAALLVVHTLAPTIEPVKID